MAGNEIQVITENGVCSSLFDIRDATADSQGNVYVANYSENTINVFAPNGTCLFKFGSTGTANGQFRTPYGVATAFDPILGVELLYVADAVNNRVQVFRLDGTFVGKFGTAGSATTPGTLYTLRRVATAVDGSGDVWVADLWGFRIERWHRTATGWTYAQTIGTPIPPTTNTAVFHEPRGLAVDSAGIVHVMDSIHHQMVRMNQNGTIVEPLRHAWVGQRAVQLATRPRHRRCDRRHLDHRHEVQPVADPATRPARFVAKRGMSGTGTGAVHLAPLDRDPPVRPDGVDHGHPERPRRRCGTWPPRRSSPRSTGPGNPGNGPGMLNRPMGIAVNEATGHIYVADTINNRIVELSAGPGGTNIQLVRTISAGFNEPEAVEVSADGTIYVADTGDNEIVMLTPTGTVIGTFGAAEGLKHPAGITTTPDGKVFVSDSFNDRVLIYCASACAPPPVDMQAPNGTVSTPTNNQAFTTTPIVFSGNATDDLSVTNVRVAIRNASTQQWWNGTAWQATIVQFEATLTAPNTPSTAWSYSWAPPGAGSYAVQVTAVDAAAKVDASKPFVPFSYAPPSSDTAAPNGTVTSPTSNQVLSASPITFSGNATDDLSVASVRLGIQNRTTLQWWNGTAFQTTATTVNATLASPGATSTGWSYVWTPPAAGSYALQVTAVDGVGKVDASKPWVPFTYSPASPDAADPNGTVTSPTSNQVVTPGPRTFTGNATDDVSVTNVRVAIRNVTTMQWWNGTGWGATFVNFEATLSAPGATSTGWSLAWTVPSGTANYAIQVTAVDAAGKVDATKPWVPFRVA